MPVPVPVLVRLKTPLGVFRPFSLPTIVLVWPADMAEAEVEAVVGARAGVVFDDVDVDVREEDGWHKSSKNKIK